MIARLIIDYHLRRLIKTGTVEIFWPDGSWTRYGDGQFPRAALEIKSAATARRLVINPDLAMGEAYMDGTLKPVECTVYDVLRVFMSNTELYDRGTFIMRIRRIFRRIYRTFSQANSKIRSMRNVKHHYDIGNDVYQIFLDSDLQYSCAYYPNGDETIDIAQIAKKRHILAKLILDRPNLNVLDIGCGWGGMALTMAHDYDANVIGITLSEEQIMVARQRAADAGLAHKCQFYLCDYRTIFDKFDRIVSVGMFEHVGVPNYSAFFEVINRCLKADGVALLHAIGRLDPPASTNPWISKYIFPGGYCPSLSEVIAPIEKSGLLYNDIEILRLHYSKTLYQWRHNFCANQKRIIDLYDDKFYRMFEFYLAGSQLAFEYANHIVFQIQLSHSIDTIPLIRDYITDFEKLHV
ncbi:SAM-dependent methyltransferase [Acidiphilium cryptum]|uniref:Cyclopropane-fatty-acyl-phospholipid synthase n=1 Tax=Acidiphilium cryptum (strain JF-5) TaxID=349163 RepID=A5FTY3_ACICJ|nr:cyclopropane-fatty-acyl-phospholipid synthase family protein [Acidiphilium cryptum]ABQ29065.1 cyclopropane-fatty-acyl-phospholipid synthase [Acidiphilium cryptum JF-5]